MPALPDAARRRLPATAGLAAVCCTVHLVMLTAGVAAVTAAAIGAGIIAVGFLVTGAGLWWAIHRAAATAGTRPHDRRDTDEATALPGTDGRS